MTFEAQFIECLGLQAALLFTVRVMTVRTANFSLTNGMVRGERCFGEYLGMAFETGVRFGHSHGPATQVIHGRMRDGHDLRQVRVGMSIMAIGAGHVLAIVIGRMPGHGGGTGVAAQAEVGTCVRRHASVRAVTTRAVKFVGP